MNNHSLTSGTITVERNNEIIATTEIMNGKYDFLIEDPEHNLNGKLILFYVGGFYAGEYIFERGGITKFDLIIQGEIYFCGDGSCLGDETYLNCPEDCGDPIEKSTTIITHKSKGQGFIEFCEPNWKCSGWGDSGGSNTFCFYIRNNHPFLLITILITTKIPTKTTAPKSMKKYALICSEPSVLT